MKFLRALVLLSASLALCSVAFLCWKTVEAEARITAAVEEVPRAVYAEGGSLKDGLTTLLDGHARKLEASIDSAVSIAVSIADRRLASIQKSADGQLGKANQSIATIAQSVSSELPAFSSGITQSVASVAADVHAVSGPIASTAGQVADAAPLFLDCQFNPSCAYNRFQGTSKSIERTMQTIAKAAPEVAESTIKIEQHAAGVMADVHREADAITKPRHWWQKLGTLLGLGAAAAIHLL